MIELLLAGGVLALLFGLGALAFVPWELLFAASFWLIGIGFAVGVPTGVIYHVQLYRTLHPRGQLAKDWIWRPIDQHHLMTRGDKSRVVPWALIGGFGFVLIVLGIIAMLASMGAFALSQSGATPTEALYSLG